MKSTVLFVGFRMVRRLDLYDYIPLAQHASNIKDPVKQKESRDQRQAAQAARLETYPFAAHIAAAHIIDGDGNVVYQGSGDPVPAAVAEILEAHLTVHEGGWSRVPTTVFGVDIRNSLRVLAAEFWCAGTLKTLHPKIWYHEPQSPWWAADPYDYIVKKEHSEDLTREAVCKFLGLPYPTDLMENAEAQAVHCRELAFRTGLIVV